MKCLWVVGPVVGLCLTGGCSSDSGCGPDDELAFDAPVTMDDVDALVESSAFTPSEVTCGAVCEWMYGQESDDFVIAEDCEYAPPTADSAGEVSCTLLVYSKLCE